MTAKTAAVSGKLGGNAMKNYITTRKLDELGRLVLPLETRSLLDAEPYCPLDIFWDEKSGALLLKRAQPVCLCCGSTENLKALPNGKYLCEHCLSSLT